MSNLPADPCAAHCPSRDLIDLVGDKWTLLVMRAVGEGIRRNGELKRRIEGISQKMLTQTLRGLERNGLVARTDLQTVPPHVEYRLTALGASLGTALSGIDRWLEANIDAFMEARRAFESKDHPDRHSRASEAQNV